jgi:YidC/Oxa1 family membrane protein insertase
MDKKNFTIGVVLLIAAFAVLYLAPKSAPPTDVRNAQPAATPSQAPATAAAGTPTTSTGAPATPAPATELAAVSAQAATAQVLTLSNNYIEARLTNFGGAVRDVAFKQHPAVLGQPEPYVFNLLHEEPMLALTEYPGLGRDKAYEVVSSSPTEVVFRTVLDGRVEVTRRYRLTAEGEAGGDPYRIHHQTTFRNLTGATAPLGRAGLAVGTAALLNSNDQPHYLNIALYDGEDAHYLERAELEGGGFFGLFSRPPTSVLERPGQTIWAGAKNQFFTSIYTPEKPATGVTVRRVALPAFPDAPQRPNVGISGTARFELPALAANDSTTLSGMLYVGPQEYRRLSRFQQKEDLVLPYTQLFFNRIFLAGYVAPLLNTLLNQAHSWVGNWGVAIIIMTLILKTVSLPFTLAASRSAKRMSKLQPAMQAIREKYKDNPAKQQQATMELFKEHKVNPIGGCIPILITFPLFIGFFAMLQCTTELRFQSFLWAPDLAAPDTVARIFGLPLNIMPLLMGATMYYQMRLTPTPSVDNMQMKMMRFMPIIFTLFCYNFSCALSLYSTINGIYTIVQQIIINRSSDDAGPASPGTAAATTASALGRMKNVTPPKNKKLK